MQDSRLGLTTAEQRGRIPSLNLLAMMLGMQPRVQLAFWAVSACCWLMSSFSSISSPKSFSSELLSVRSAPSYTYLCESQQKTWQTIVKSTVSQLVQHESSNHMDSNVHSMCSSLCLHLQGCVDAHPSCNFLT